MPPNLIILLADDLGYGDLGCYGNPTIPTPHLDALAAEGLRFTDFHASGPVCSPTRAGLLTGRYQQRAGIPEVLTARGHRDGGLDPREVTFSRLLHDAGYRTAVFGKWHLGYRRGFNPLRHGFEEFRGYVSGNVDYVSHVDQTGRADWWNGLEPAEEPGYTTHLITRHALRFIEAGGDRPFCLYVAHEAPHYPYQGPSDPADRTVGGEAPPLGTRTDRAAAYREMIEAFDSGVGQIVAALRRLGIAERTLVFCFSDNGATGPGSNAPLRGRKGDLWEGGHRVPAVAWWPGRIRGGEVSGELAASLDLMPTLLALGGAEGPRGHPLDGADLGPVLLEGRGLPDRTLFWGFRDAACMRDGPWKLVAGQKGTEAPALFDLSADPGETTDLSAREPARVRRMLEAIDAWQQDVKPSGPA